MGEVTDGGWVPEDDPMFNGSLMMFSVRKPKQSTEPGKEENPKKSEAESSEEEPKA
jgi:hypothetical protein